MYYAMMDVLKSLSEFRGLLVKWEENELKEAETHKSLERAMDDLVSNGVLSADAFDCISRTEAFLNNCRYIPTINRGFTYPFCTVSSIKKQVIFHEGILFNIISI